MGSMNVQKQDAAYISGKRTARNLAGYTTKEQQREVLSAVSLIDKDTVKTYLTGYKSPKKSNIPLRTVTTAAVANVNIPIAIGLVAGAKINSKPSPFFEQVMSEYGFEEKEQVARDVAGKLRDYLQAQGRTKEAEQIQQILNNRKLYSEDIRDLDRIANITINHNY